MRARLLRLTVPALLCWQASAQTVTPAKPVVRAGETLAFTADRPVTWSLVPGSAGSIDSTGIYRAPASVRAPRSLAGCQIGAPDSVFNTRIDNLPLHARNAEWMAALPNQGIAINPSWGVNIVDNQTPFQNLTFNYTPAYNNLPFQIPAWPNLKRESGVFSDPLTDVDRHVLTVNRETCQVYDLYNNYPPGTAGSQAPENTYTAQSGWTFNSMSYGLPTSGASDASGMALAPTTLSLDDIRSGVLRHALRVTFANAYIAPRPVWPATTNAGAYGTVPYGTRFRLRAGFDISSFSPTAQIILTGLKQYGMIISDGGANWDIIASTDLTEDREVHAALLEIGARGYLINSTQFEIVDESSLMVDPYSAQIKPGNGYVTPPAFAIVQANDGIHTPVTTPIALQGVGLNAPEGGGVWIQPGVSKTLEVFVGGTSNKAVTWSMSPALGTLDSLTGVYVGPAVSAPVTTSITATSVADPNASVTFPLTVLPAGAIRIVAGDATLNPAAPNTYRPDYGPDSQGNIWWRDQAAERGWGVKNDYWYGPNYGFPAPWLSTTDIYRYQTQYYNTGDTVYRFSVPNGNYDIDYYVAQGDCDATNTRNVLWYREHLEAQGQIGAHDFRPMAASGGNCYTPVHTTIPAQVTDNNLYFALRRITDHNQTGAALQPVTTISSFSITPSAGIPHITLDPATPPALTVSQTAQLYAVGWFMSSSVTWSLVSGPGNLDAQGLYTAPARPIVGTAVVRATSTVDPSITATQQINLIFGNMSLAPGSVTLNRSATQLMTASISNQPYSNVTWAISPRIGRIDASGLYIAPDALGADTVITIVATSIDDPTQSASATLTVRAVAPPLRMNCTDAGGFTDAQGNEWVPDFGFSGTSHAYGVSIPIARTTPDMYVLYGSSRYSYTNENFEYNLPFPNGEYLVTLKFADYSFDSPGGYNFDVQINGTTVLHNFDPDTVYGTSKTAVDKTFVALVADKNLRIAFLGHQGGAFINGIQIVPTVSFSRLITGQTVIAGKTR